MKILVLAMTILAGAAMADEDPLAQYAWTARPLVIFAPSENDPRFVQQMEWIAEREEELTDRDVVVLTDTDPAARGPLRKALRPFDFQIVLIGKDGDVKLRKPGPWDVRELSRAIDKMPMRQQEIDAARN